LKLYRKLGSAKCRKVNVLNTPFYCVHHFCLCCQCCCIL